MVLVLGAPAWAGRPQFSLTVESAAGHPFVVHGPDGSTALLSQVRDAADRAWQAELDAGGWPSPPPDTAGPDDRYDIYLESALAEDEAYVNPGSQVMGVPYYETTSYMGLPLQFSDDAALFSTVAHELNHASQFASDAAEDDAFFEHTAVFVEQRVANDFAAYGVGIADYQAHPERALGYLGSDQYEYGAALWLMFLSERLDNGGAALVQRLWRDTRQAGDVNQPHYLNALDGILGDQGWTRARFFAEFSLWRWFTGPRDDGRHFLVGKDWGASSLAPSESVTLPTVAAASVGAYGAHLLVLDAPPPNLLVQPSGDGAAVAVVALDGNGAALGDPTVIEAAQPSVVTLPPGAAQALVALTWAPADYDPNSHDFAARPVAVSLAAAALPDASADAGAILDLATIAASPDSSVADSSPIDLSTGFAPSNKNEGCGCAVGSAGSGGALGLLGLMLLGYGFRRLGFAAKRRQSASSARTRISRLAAFPRATEQPTTLP